MSHLRIRAIPELIRRPAKQNLPKKSLPEQMLAAPEQLHMRRMGPTERRYYIAFMVIASLNLMILCGAATFFALALHQ